MNFSYPPDGWPLNGWDRVEQDLITILDDVLPSEKIMSSPLKKPASLFNLTGFTVDLKYVSNYYPLKKKYLVNYMDYPIRCVNSP